MKKTTLLCVATGIASAASATQAADMSKYFSMEANGFKRFSVSIGALHVMPQGKAQPFKVNTAATEGYISTVSTVELDRVIETLDPNDTSSTATLLKGLQKVRDSENISNIPIFGETISNTLKTRLKDLPAGLSGEASITGLETWDNAGTGLEADDVTTLGIMTNYYFTDNISFEMKAGIPPKVDLQGKGKIYAPFSATATPIINGSQLIKDLFPTLSNSGFDRLIDRIDALIPGTQIGNTEGIPLSEMKLKENIEITDLSAHGAAASARAWTPAFEFQYHFGKTGVNKFRPYIGVGLMYAYFNELEINPQTEKDLIAAGHMIANILDGKAGASLEKKPNDKANPRVKVEATDAFAPVVTAGFTYDFNDKWFAVASVTYAHLKNETTITVTDDHFGKLIESKADIEVNPLLAYAGIGMRF